MLKENLLQLGFSSNKTEVYLALLELGQTKVGPILNKTSFHRNIVYRELDSLIKIKLVNVINKRGVNYYSAIDPQPLLSEQQNRMNIAKEVLKEIKNHQSQSFSEVMIFSGNQGILDLCEMVLTEKADLYVVGGLGNVYQIMGAAYNKFQKRADNIGIKQHLLLQKEAKYEMPKNLNITIKYLPRNFPATPYSLWIFSSSIAHVVWEKTQTIFIIKNSMVADSYRKYYQLLLSQSK